MRICLFYFLLLALISGCSSCSKKPSTKENPYTEIYPEDFAIVDSTDADNTGVDNTGVGDYASLTPNTEYHLRLHLIYKQNNLSRRLINNT